MRIALTLLAALLLVGALATASTLEQSLSPVCARTGLDPHACTYQHDAGGHGDAADTCATAKPGVPVGKLVSGLLVHGDDPEDHYQLVVTDKHVGRPLTVAAWGHALLPGTSGSDGSAQSSGAPTVQVWVPGCKEPARGEAYLRDDGANVVTFVPRTAGTYVVSLVHVAPSPGPAPSTGMGATTCHPMCVGSGVVGNGEYDLLVSSG